MEKMITGLKSGQERMIARAISLVENNDVRGYELLKKLYPTTSLAYLLGITGPPGSGKSTLTGKIIKYLRKQGGKIGVLAIDPTSQFSGGALLGDRIRMDEVVTDSKVFIRSMATRGALGGLNSSVFDAVLILSAAGYDYIIIETVGVGQNEIDIVNLADTVLVVTTPEGGDEIQTFKAGIMETASIFVINKSDRPGIEKMELTLEQMLELKEYESGDWKPPIVKTVATGGEGVKQLLVEVENHQRFLQESPRKEERKQEIMEKQLINLMEKILRRQKIEPVVNSDYFKEKIESVLRREIDPYTLAEKLINRGGGSG